MIYKIEEASRQDLLQRSRRGSRQRYLKRLNYQVSNFKGVDLAQLFEKDYFVFSTPINNYVCTIAFPGVLSELREVAKATRGDATKINLQLVIKALRKAFDKTDDVKVRCTCGDFQFRFMYYAYKGGYLYGDPIPKTKEPPRITNPLNNIGATCKHLDLFLSNKKWLTKAASVVNALIKAYPDKAAMYLYNEEDLPKEDEVEEEPVKPEENEAPVEDNTTVINNEPNSSEDDVNEENK